SSAEPGRSGSSPPPAVTCQVPDQVRRRPPGPAVQVVGCDGVRDLGGVERLLQPFLQRHQRVRVGHQLLDAPLQLGLQEVDVLESCPQVARPVGLALLGVGLAVLLQSFGLSLNAAGPHTVVAGLLEDAVVVGEPFRRAVFSGAVSDRGGAR
uniref:Uncharacterized protein n=1 Tax=Takifugu rubripes TaxID=31033 RepID=A0A3B5KJ43_TAKRU